MDVTPWVPNTALIDGRVENTLCACLDEWQACWFTGQLARSLPGTALSKKSDVYKAGDDIFLTVSDVGYIHIMNSILEIDIGHHDVTELDDHFLRDVFRRALSDLVERITEICDINAPLEKTNGVIESAANAQKSIVRLCGKDGTVWLDLMVGAALLPRIRLHDLPRCERPPIEAEWEEAFSEQSTQLQAYAGRANLTLQDVEALQVGTMVTLDTHMGSGFDVLADGHPVLDIQARYVRVRKSDDKNSNDNVGSDKTSAVGGFIMEAHSG